MSSWKLHFKNCLLGLSVVITGCQPDNPYAISRDAPASDQRRLLKLAESGDPQAQYLVGYIYEHGKGREPNQKLAIEWYKRAVMNGNESAFLSLFNIYDSSSKDGGVDMEAVLFWLVLAAKQGDPFAQAKLALHYNSSNDPEKLYLAIAWGSMVSEYEVTRLDSKLGKELQLLEYRFADVVKERSSAVTNLLRQAVNSELWKKELMQGMGTTNQHAFEWTLEYLSKPGLIPPAPPARPGNTSDKKRKAFLDELLADNIAYVLIGKSTMEPECFREHLYKKIRASKFETMLCVTNRQTITILTDELCRSRKPRDSDFLETPQSHQIYVSKTGDVVAYCFAYRVNKSVSVCKNKVLRRNRQFYIRWDWDGISDPKENVDYVACQSDKYAEMISELLKNKDK